MKKTIIPAGLVLLFLGACAIGIDALPRKVLLGTRSVDFQVDYDEIIVSSARGWFRKIEFLVTGNDLVMYDVDVVYSNGQKDDIPTELKFTEGERSRIIDLQRGRRHIQKIIFKYRTVGALAEGKAHIKLFGIR